MEHEDLIRAIADRDAEAAEKAARRHIESSRDIVMKALHSEDSLTIGRVARTLR
jgi:DNA-binding GntR family transcriptional regulator